MEETQRGTVQLRLTDKKSIWLYMILSCAVYFSSYITRLDYMASISAIVSDMGVTKQLASLAVTGSFITYGLGQLISGAAGDRLPPQRVIFAGLIGTCMCNFLLPVLPNIWAMTVVWCFNGFFQSMLWPPLVRIMAALFDEKMYHKACIYVNAAASAGTIAVYLLIPMCIVASGWRTAFYVTGGIGIVVAVVWIIFTGKFNFLKADIPVGDSENAKPARFSTIFVCEGLVFAMLAIMFQGMLRDGITTWMPSFINENFNLGTSSSILTTVILPVFSILSYTLASAVNRRLKDELKSSVLFFACAAVASVVLMILFSRCGASVSIALMAIITGCAHGINLMLVCDLPVKFVKYGKVSTVSGLLNTFTYVGSAVSTFGIAALADAKGWYFAIGGWVVTAVLGVAMCVFNLVYLKKRQ